MTGTIGILNVGAGDTKLTFDKSNPAECIRAARIVKDMLRRGYALLIEIERDGKKAYERVRDFREETCEYIIADFDPIEAAEADEQEKTDAPAPDAPAAAEGSDTPAPERAAKPVGKRRGRPRTRAVAATGARGIAVSRIAGG